MLVFWGVDLKMVLLMVQNPANHLGYINLVNNGDELPTSTGLAGFLPSTVFQMNDQMSLSKIKILKLDSISI